MADYAPPEVLVSTEWLAHHLREPRLRIVEVDVDTSAYEQGHIPGAVGWNWQTQLCDQVWHDILTREQFERLMSEASIGPTTTITFYGDNHHWFTTYALW
jgi:thiosulfate/3-mercaptopyruvate sulfurtransferase